MGWTGALVCATGKEMQPQLYAYSSSILNLSMVACKAWDISFSALADIPTAGVLSRSKISENNKAVTMDRIFFTMNHFHNALQGDTDTSDAIPASDLSIQRYTFGLEKRFLDELWSA